MCEECWREGDVFTVEGRLVVRGHVEGVSGHNIFTEQYLMASYFNYAPVDTTCLYFRKLFNTGMLLKKWCMCGATATDSGGHKVFTRHSYPSNVNCYSF